MALNWRWEEKIGEALFDYNDKQVIVNLYQGNAYLIFINEYNENGKDMYSMFSFWVDESHMKNCLGLNKGTDNIYTDESCKLREIWFDKNYRYLNKVVPALVKAFDNIDIHIWSRKESE